MPREEKALFALVVIGLGATTGCTGDARRSAEYEVVVDVRDAASDEPLASGIVVCQPTSGPMGATEPDLTEDAAIERFYEKSWTTVTDGQAILTLRTMRLCTGGVQGLRRGCPPAPSVLGDMYLIRVDADDASELLTIEVTPGAIATGEHFVVVILTVEQ